MNLIKNCSLNIEYQKLTNFVNTSIGPAGVLVVMVTLLFILIKTFRFALELNILGMKIKRSFDQNYFSE